MFTSEQDFSFKQFFIPLTLRKIISIIAVVGFLVFFNMLFNDFVWDDKTYILNNPQTHQINFLLSFGKNIFNDVGQYRPIPATYFSFLYRLFGDTSFFYHLLQLLLHITCTVFVYLIFRK